MAPSMAAPLQATSSTDISDEEELQVSGSRRWSGMVAVSLIGLVMLGLAARAITGQHVTKTTRAGSQWDGVVGLAAKANNCSWGLQNCNASKCCNNPGMQCYEQTNWYAQCREACTQGPDPGHWDALSWTCKELGDRKEGSSKCSDLGENCKESQCCSVTNTQCFEKNAEWATCKSECTAGFPDMSDADGKPWTCNPLGDWKKGASDWVAQKCSTGSDDCSSTQCCAEPGKQCYQQQEFFSQCKFTCPENEWESDWSCTELGARTPDVGGATPGKLGDWVKDTCVEDNVDCRTAKCCLNMNKQCYEKNKDWGVCLESCSGGRHPEDNNATWSCKELGPRMTSGLAVKGSPSLFCWSLFMTTTYENDIIHNQMDKEEGIFQCDDYALLSTSPVTDMGKTKDGKHLKTIQIEKAEITTTLDGTAGNAKLFINCWTAIVEDGRWKQHAWTIKVDPDAVIIPSRVRDHMKSHMLENVYVVNCNAFPDSPNFPMMYGSVEIYSYQAIDAYARRSDECITDMGSMLSMWGEDYYMTHCLDRIGVGRVSDFASVGDNVCSGGACGDQFFSAFHPYKTVELWQSCWDEAHGKTTPPPPVEQQQWM